MDPKLIAKLCTMSEQHYHFLLEAQRDELAEALQEAWRHHESDNAMKFNIGHSPHITRQGSLWTVGGSLTVARRRRVTLDDTPLDLHDMFGFGAQEEGSTI